MASRAVAKAETNNFISEWVAAGATVGVLGPDSFLNRPRKADETLAFHFDRPTRVADLLRLPVPTEPFALSFREMDDDAVKGIARFRTLCGLIVSHTQAGNKAAGEIAGCKSLRFLAIDETPLTDSGAARLAELRNLEHLSLWRGNYCRLGSKPMAFLTHLRKLKHLGISYTKFDNDDLDAVSRLPNLRYLSVFRTSITNVGLSHLVRAKKLRVLEIGGTRVTGAAGPVVGKMKHLEGLDLHGLPFRDGHLAPLSQLRSLKELSLEGTHVTGEGLRHLSGLTELKKLNLWSLATISEEGLDNLAGLRLTELLLHHYHTPTSPKFVARIAACHDPNVVGLPLQSAPVGDAELKVLAKFKRLEAAGGSGDGLTDEGLRLLSRMPALKSLGIGSEAITDDGIRALGKLKQLTTLVVTSDALSDGAVADVIAAQTNLQSLNLSVQFGTRVMQVISAASKLQDLSLRHSSLTNPRLAELGHLPNLRRVWLVGTSVTPAGLTHLRGRNLEWLILDDRLKTAAAFPHYLKALGDSPDDLRLDEWQVGDDDLVHLASCPGLTEIRIRGSMITPAGLKHLHGLTQLKRVWLDGQKRWKAAAAALKKALPNCDVYD